MPYSREPNTLWQRPARRLPIPVAPLSGEVLISYVRRLAVANGIAPTLLVQYLGSTSDHRLTPIETHDLILNQAALARLSTFGGVPETVLSTTMSMRLSIFSNPRPSRYWTPLHPIRNLVRPCSRCAARRGVAGLAIVRMAQHQPSLCLRHGRALATHLSVLPELSLEHAPEILAAAHRHRVLRRRRRRTTDTAFHAAATLTSSWKPHGWPRGQVEGIDARWLARAGKILLPHFHELVRYPETVALAGLMSDLDWPPPPGGIHNRPTIHEPVRFLYQAALCLDHPNPSELLRRSHPLNRWAGYRHRPAWSWASASELARIAHRFLSQPL